ncbi:hypothetical protein L6452_31274 [Arctium lappa]|uniref:Uncharacterized protein n=1 Tax=Arctium lappa TaxID=4217 RepID=A0ACB8ZK07_ARCLA|nr:hypothetical protein L6452_31274 [Arctium lappa]
MEANSPEQQPEKTTAAGDSLSETPKEQQGDEETFVIKSNGYSPKPKKDVWVPNAQLSNTMMEEYDDFTKRDEVEMTKEREVSDLDRLNGSDLGRLNGDKRSGPNRSDGPLKDDLNGYKRFGLSNIKLNEVPGPWKNEVKGEGVPIPTGQNHQVEKGIMKIGPTSDHVVDGIQSQGNSSGERINTQIKSNRVNRVKVSTNNGDK